MSTPLSPEEDQPRILAEAMKSVREQAFYMKRAIDSDNLKVTLEHATEMLRELRTNILTPKSYYELYMRILDEMRELEDYFVGLQRNGSSMNELYERVQGCANVLPRLYLMCCVGGVLITSKEVLCKDVLLDLIEMIKGVQHPTRGLFLRHYLSHVTKNRLPDKGSPYDGDGGSIRDALSFVIRNFQESNRLWVRMQNQGASKERKKREKERQDLRILVGTNLVRLSQLEGLDVEEYKENVLPSILEQITECKDIIAQSYLMDCIIQVFPDDFHLQTLETLLKTCTTLKEKVNVRAVLEALMERLSNYYVIMNSGQASGEPIIDMSGDVNAFTMLNDCVSSLIEERASMTLAETLRLEAALLNFAMKCHPERIEYVSHCLNNCVLLMEKSDIPIAFSESEGNERGGGGSSGNKKLSADDIAAQTQLEATLLSVLPSLGLQVLDLPPFLRLIPYIPWSSWREVSASMLRGALQKPTQSVIGDVSQAERLLSAILPLLRDQTNASLRNMDSADGEDDTPKVPTIDETFRSEQILVARVIHLMKAAETDAQVNMYLVLKAYFSRGGPLRIQFTIVPLVFAYLSLIRRIWARETAQDAVNPLKIGTRKVFQMVMETISILANSHPLAAFKLYLEAAQAADQCDGSAIAYEFAKEALLLYECEVTDSKAQVRAVTSMCGTLLNCKRLSTEDYEALVTKIAQYSNKLLKKPDQCRMVTICSHLFWPDGGSRPTGVDAERVLECLQRALKVASTCSPLLYVDILDRYVYFFEKNHPSMQDKHINSLIALTNEQLGSNSSDAQVGSGSSGVGLSQASVEIHYRNTVGYIRSRQLLSETTDKFSRIELS